MEIAACRKEDNAQQVSKGLHITAAPNDSGLTVGGSWAIVPPNQWQPLQYAPLLKRCDSAKLWVVPIFVVWPCPSGEFRKTPVPMVP